MEVDVADKSHGASEECFRDTVLRGIRLHACELTLSAHRKPGFCE